MSKTAVVILVIAAILFVCGAIAAGIYFAGVSNSATPAPPGGTTSAQLPTNSTTTYSPPATQTQTTSINGTISLTGQNGSTITTTDFMTDPAVVKDPINSGHYYFGYHIAEGVPDPTATSNPPYVIEYIASTQYFSIALLQEPIAQTRQAAEQYLMTHLGITQSQMCQLNYMVSVPARVNSYYAGTSLGFSFCPGAVQL